MTHRSIQQLGRATVYDRDGVKLGRVKEVYINNKTGEPDYAEVSHGLFGMRSTVVPLRGHTLEDRTLKLAFSKDLLKDAPEISKKTQLPKRREDHNQICEYYGLTDTADVHSYGDQPLYSGDEFSRGHTTRGFGDSEEPERPERTAS
ncbi:PRC-barrel domain containing protein [Corynebacterium hylobatis]|uniref:PRC-barrel domain containing protein n=1 Tax=Corynebacterium hylobatis TaxID=1859290 RepID=A0A3S0B5R4_9CORY|nr:PRC-barrel domain-containing protein [Corynebacterium hylobatis]RSZ65173.1 PRC-barrel domain containing protein [Corynebacterium hylobatis]